MSGDKSPLNLLPSRDTKGNEKRGDRPRSARIDGDILQYVFGPPRHRGPRRGDRPRCFRGPRRGDRHRCFESGESSGEVSLADLFAGKGLTGAHPALSELPDVAQAICRGGWAYTRSELKVRGDKEMTSCSGARSSFFLYPIFLRHCS